MATAQYGDLAYWEAHYESVDPEGAEADFEWYQGFNALRRAVEAHVPAPLRDQALVLGCGNSLFGEQLAQAGLARRVVSVDFSPAVVSAMLERELTATYDLHYAVMDCTALDFEAGLFGCAYDKGTLDAILCGREGAAAAVRALGEAARVLRPGEGRLMLVSCHPPSNVVPRLREAAAWAAVLVDAVPKGYRSAAGEGCHWVYVCTAGAPPFAGEPEFTAAAEPYRAADAEEARRQSERAELAAFVAATLPEEATAPPPPPEALVVGAEAETPGVAADAARATELLQRLALLSAMPGGSGGSGGS